MSNFARPVFQGSFKSAQDGDNRFGKRPVIFDILGPDGETSILPEDIKLVLHVNPSTMKFSFQKQVQRIQTKGGFVEQHWGEGNTGISFESSTGAFMRLYTGSSNITGGGLDVGGTRRDTLAYDKFLDFLALFHNNASIYDNQGNIVFQGLIKVMFDGDTFYGWFNSFTISEASEKPYQFNLSAGFVVGSAAWQMKTTQGSAQDIFL